MDVAEAAGVAIGTASRVLNNQPNVNDEVRRKVLEAAKELKYVSLRKRKSVRRDGISREGAVVDSESIGVLIFGLDQSFVRLPITAQALQGVERQLAQMNWNMLLSNVPELDRVPAFLANRSVKGLILRSPVMDKLPDPSENEFIRKIQELPSVWLFGKPDKMSGDLCAYDSARAVTLVIEHFLEMGHQRIAFLNPRPGNLLQEQLKKHFFFAANKAGLETTLLEKKGGDPLVLPMHAIQDVRHVKPLLEQWKKMPVKSRPTGIFVGADSAAVQIYNALDSMGLKVGRDVSICSCNHEQSLTNLLSPQLTTVEIFSEVVGRRAVDQLIWRLRNPEEEQAMRLLVEPQLVLGKSVENLK